MKPSTILLPLLSLLSLTSAIPVPEEAAKAEVAQTAETAQVAQKQWLGPLLTLFVPFAVVGGWTWVVVKLAGKDDSKIEEDK